MPLGATIDLELTSVQQQADRAFVFPIQFPSAWQTVIDAGGMDDADASPIVNPTTEITTSDRHIFKVKRGTTLRFRMKYDDGVTVPTDPVINVFGRLNSNDPWMPLQNKNGAQDITMTTALADDVRDGTFRYTTPDIDAAAVDCEGCMEILVGVKTAFAATGDVTTATLEAKAV